MAQTDQTKTKAKRGRPYKNPHLLPPGLAVIGKDELKALKEDRNQLLVALKLVFSDTNARFGRDPVSNMPLSEIIGSAIRNVESHIKPEALEAIYQNVSDLEDLEYAHSAEDAEEWERRADQENTYEENRQ